VLQAVAEVQALADAELLQVRVAAQEMPAAVAAEFAGVDVTMAALSPRDGLEDVWRRLRAVDGVLRHDRRLDGDRAA